MQKVKAQLTRYKCYVAPVSYFIIAVLATILYLPAREHMIVQDAWIWIIKSNVTFNFILFFFLWGIISDKYTKHMKKWQGWLIFSVGLVAIVLMFHFWGGYETIWSKQGG